MELPRIERSVELYELHHQTSPTCLVICTKSCTNFSVEMIVETDVIPPVRVGLELLFTSTDSTFALLASREDADQAFCYIPAHI